MLRWLNHLLAFVFGRGTPVRRPVVEEVEPRILYSADVNPLLWAGQDPNPTAIVAAVDTSSTDTTVQVVDAQQQRRREIVFVDAAVSDAQTLIDDILAQRGDEVDIEIVQLRADADGLQQISDVLAGEQGVDAVHILSHGASGQLQLGNRTLDAQALEARAQELSRWAAALTDQADVLLYGCDVAAGSDGAHFVARLAALTGADVAASDDVTGAAAKGGDWTLEQQVGVIETQALASQAFQSFFALVPQGGETLVNTTTAGTQSTMFDNRQVAMDANGNFVVVWQDGSGVDGSGIGIYAQRYNSSGVAQGGQFRVNTYTSSDQYEPQVAMDTSGNFVVVWQSLGQDGGGLGVYAQRYNAAGVAQGSEFRVNTATVQDQSTPAVAMDGSGNFVVTWAAWNQDAANTWGLYAQRYNAAGAAQGSEFRVNTTLAGDQTEPAIAMDSAGNFVIAWMDSALDGSGSGIYAQRFNAVGAAQGSEFRVNAVTANAQEYPAVAMDSSGFVVTWESSGQDGSGYASYAQRYNAAGVAQGGPISLATTTANDQWTTSVAMTGGGGFVASWTSVNQDGSGAGVYVRQFDANGNAVTGEVRANTTTTNGQDNSSIATNSQGQLVAVWSGQGSGDTSGVFLQRFAITGITVTPTSGLVTTEAGAQASFTVVLDSAPTANVTIAVSVSNALEASVSTALLTFTTANWNVAQTVTVTGRDDVLDDGDRAYSVVLAAASSTDGNYNGIDPTDVALTNTDDDNRNTIAVTTAGDVADGDISSLYALLANKGADGQISLREAIIAANNTANGSGGADRIHFDIAGTGVHTISLSSLLPAITAAVEIDASTDDSFAAQGSRPAIVLNGAGTIQDGLQIYGAASGGSTVRGLIIQGFTQDGIDIASSNGNTIAGNWIGLDSTGTAAVANNYGINVWNSNDNVIGGSTAADRNVVSGSSSVGIAISTDNGTSSGNQIRGNYIGTDATGAAGIGNANQGIWVNAGGNTIGGTLAGQGNVISGTVNWVGVQLEAAASGTLIAGNLIGLNAAGTAALANAGGGVYISSANNTIGGTTAAARNVISGNGGPNLMFTGATATGNVVIGNYIGTNAAGTADVNGTVRDASMSGVVMTNGASNNRVGTDADGVNDVAERNVISGNNWYGVEFIGSGTSGNVAQGNYIGVDVTGQVALGNAQGGVSFWDGAGNNRLGGGAAGAGNVISGNETGVLVANGVTNNKVQGNLIGLAADGVTLLGNTGTGVYFYNGGTSALVTGNVIGTDADGSNDAGERNVISGNYHGVAMANVEVTGNVVAGNYIGTDASGLLDRGNLDTGVLLFSGATGNTIGGSTTLARNVISGNETRGIYLAGASGNTVRGNYIGLASNGTGALGNGFSGIYLTGGSANNAIGGAGAGDGNTIAYNSMPGISLGSDAGTGNAILRNAIYANGGDAYLAINLSGGSEDAYEVTPNDAGDGDTGANNLQNYPVLDAATINGTQLLITGSLNSVASGDYRIEFFATASGDASGHGEAQRYLGFVNVSTDGSGNATISTTLTASVLAGEVVTATATRANATYTSFTDTSEMSANVTVRGPNAAPSGSNGTIAVTEDTTYTFTTADFGFTDSDGDSLLRVWFDTLPGSGTLLWNGAAFAAGNFVTADDISAGLLTYVPAAEVSGAGVSSFTFRVQDDGGTANGGSDTDATANTINVDITAVNDAPTDIVFDSEATAESTVNTYSTNNQSQPAIAALANGGYVAVWVSDGQDGSGLGVYGQRFDAAGVKVGAEFLVTGELVDNETAPSISTFADGGFVVAWQDQITGVRAWIEARVFNADGSAATAEFQVSPGNDGSNEGYMPAVLVLDGSRFVVVWSNEIGSATYQVAGRIYDRAGVPQGAQFNVGALLSDTALYGAQPEVTLLNDGGFAVVWRTYDGTSYGSRLRIMNGDGTARSSEIVLQGDNHADVSALANGNIVAVYGDGGDISASIFNASGTEVVPEFAVNTATAGVQGAPTVTRSDDGFVVAWQSDTGDGSGSSVFAQRFDANGSRVGSEVLVNATTAGAQALPAAVETTSGQVRLIWASEGVDGSGLAVVSRVVATGNAQVAENSANGTRVADVLGVQDPDVGDTATFSLIDDAGGRFAIDASTGVISVANGALLDYEAATSHTITVRVTDSGGGTRNEALTITLTNVNDAPLITSNAGGSTAAVSVAESQTAVTTVTATDADTGATLTYSIAGGADAARFSIDSNTGVLTFVAAPDAEAPADVGANNVYDVTVQVSDSAGGTDTQAIAVTVTGVNEAPAFTGLDGTPTYTEGGAAVVLDGNVTVLDPEYAAGTSYSGAALVLARDGGANSQDQFSATGTLGALTQGGSLIVGGTTVGNVITNSGGLLVLSFNGNATNTLVNSVLQQIAYSNSSDTPPSSARINWTFNDNNGGAQGSGGPLSGTGSTTVTIVSTNDAPVLSTTGSSLAYTENAAATAVDGALTVSDADSATLTGATVTLSANYASGQDVLAFTNQLGITGSWNAATGVLTLSGSASVADYQAALRSVTYANTSDAPSTATRTVSFVVSDGAASNTAATRNIVVTAVNDAPLITSNGGGATAAISVTENQTAVSTVTATDADAGATLTYAIAGGADAARFSIDSSTGVLTFVAAPDAEAPADNGANNVYDVTVQVSDGAGGTDTQAIAVTVGSVNEAPSFTSLNGAPTYTEGGSAVVLDADVQLSDPELGAANAYAGATLTLARSGGANAQDALAFDGVNVTTSGANVLVGGVQVGTYSFTGGEMVVTFGANATQARVDTLLRNVVYWNTSDTPPASVQIGWTFSDGNTGTQGTGGALTATGSTTVTIVSTNDAPVVTTTGSSLAYTENAAALAVDGALTLSDADSTVLTGATVRIATNYASGQDVLAFTDQSGISGNWNAGTGVLTLSGSASLADYQAALRTVTYVNSSDAPSTAARSIEFTVSDAQASSSAASRTLLVGAVNDAPVITSDGGAASAGVTVSENETAVTTVTSSDVDGGTAVYSIVGGADAARFVIDASTGVLTFNTAPNYESPADTGADNVYDVTVQVSDGAGGTDTQAISVTVTPVNDNPPVIGSNGGGATAAVNVAENQTAVTTVTATDADAPAQSLGYTISGGADAALFLIDALTGALVFNAAPDVESPGDADGDNVYEVTVQVSDGNGGTDSQAIVITLTNVNEAPVITSASSTSAAENQTAVQTVTSGDVDGGAAVYTIVGGADAGHFSVDATTGALSFVVAPDFEAPADADGDNVYNVTVQVADGNGGTATQAIAVTVTNVNEAPVVTSSATVSAAENQSAAITVTSSDVDGGVASYSIVGGADAALFSVDAATGVLTFNTAPDFEASADADGDNVYAVTVQVADGNGGTVTQTIAVTVTNVNEAPVITSAAAVSAAENQTAVTTVTRSDVDGGAAGYTIVGGADAALFSVDAATGVLTFTSAPDFEAPVDADGDNVYDVTVQVADGNGGFDTQAVAVTVTNLNEAPVITSNGGGASAAVDADENQNAVGTITSIDEDADMPIYSIVGGADAALFSIDSTSGVLVFNSAPNFEAPADADGDNVYELTVQVDDGNGGFDSQQISVTVRNVNEAPVITSSGNITIDENQTAVMSVASTDVDGGAAQYSIAGGVDAARFAIDAAAGTLSFRSAPDFEAPSDADLDNVYEFVVSVDDGNGGTDMQSIAVAVTGINEAPGNIAPAAAELIENAPAGTVVAIVTASDPDAGELFTFTLVTDGAGRFVVDPASGRLQVAPGAVFDFQNEPSHALVLRVTDSQGLRTEQTIVVTLREVAEVPVDMVPPDVTPPPAPSPAPAPAPAPGAPAITPVASSTLEEIVRGDGREQSEQATRGLFDLTTDGEAASNARWQPQRGRSAGGDAPFLVASVSLGSDGGGFGGWSEDALNGLLQPQSEGAAQRFGLFALRGSVIETDISDGSSHPASRDADEALVAALQDPVRVASATLTAGFVWWLTRSGGLLTSILMGIPAWRHVDLLPVLAPAREDEDDDGLGAESQDEGAEPDRRDSQVDDLFSNTSRMFGESRFVS